MVRTQTILNSCFDIDFPLLIETQRIHSQGYVLLAQDVMIHNLLCHMEMSVIYISNGPFTRCRLPISYC